MLIASEAWAASGSALHWQFPASSDMHWHSTTVKANFRVSAASQNICAADTAMRLVYPPPSTSGSESRVLFAVHNPNSNQMKEGRIDLQEQRVNEALFLTKKYYDEACRRGLKELRLVVRKGLHSIDGPVLKPRILNALKKWGVTAAVEKYNGGVIVAQI
ncbi:hypothetical protein K488DRAFT_82657 [Vararia minispora EC-137]|uniref:Uncharacterized protein n=1 Tax=Vararia minispora EC-137 TaxID=1314806 RepID=A0ACB8QVM2_9AGAM|nr:hypothetical protein K488DRAFT_82657 [Vararia minispora EC-137]